MVRLSQGSSKKVKDGVSSIQVCGLRIRVIPSKKKMLDLTWVSSFKFIREDLIGRFQVRCPPPAQSAVAEGVEVGRGWESASLV